MQKISTIRIGAQYPLLVVREATAKSATLRGPYQYPPLVDLRDGKSFDDTDRW
jgi:hypothetical protein